MESHDRLTFLKENYELKNLRNATHWMIEVVAPQHEEGFKVYIFASNFDGNTQGYDKPLFETKKTYSLEKAIQLVDELEEEAQKDELYQHSKLQKNKLFISLIKKRRVFIVSVKRKKRTNNIQFEM